MTTPGTNKSHRAASYHGAAVLAFSTQVLPARRLRHSTSELLQQRLSAAACAYLGWLSDNVCQLGTNTQQSEFTGVARTALYAQHGNTWEDTSRVCAEPATPQLLQNEFTPTMVDSSCTTML